MILPVLKVFTLTKGVTFDYQLQWLQGVPGSAVTQSLSNWLATLTITDWQGATTLMTLNTGVARGSSGIFFGGSQADPANGIIDIIISGTDTAAITWPTARYSLILTTPDRTTQHELLYGQFVVLGFLP